MIKTESSKEQEKPLPRNTKKIILITTLSIVALGVLTYLTMHYTSQPNFCASCHEIRTAVNTWNAGPHKSVTCLDCHSNPGKVGYVTRKIRGLGEVYLHVTKQIPTTLVAKYNIQTCIVCHTGNNKDYPNAKNIKLAPGEPLAPGFSHTEILQTNASCHVCHKNVGHAAPQQLPQY